MASRSYSRTPSRSKQAKSRGRSRSNDKRRQSPDSPKRQIKKFDKVAKCRKLFVTNIDAQFTGEQVKLDLERAFEVYGKINQIVVKTKQGSNNSYAFVQFTQIDSAVNALENMRGKIFKGKQLKVEFGKGEKKPQERHMCYICQHSGHYAKDCRERDRDRDRDYRDRDYRDRDRSYRDHRDRNHRERNQRSRSHHRQKHRRPQYSRSRSSSSSDGYYRRKRSRSHDRYRKREQHYDKSRSPDRKGSSGYYSRNH